MHILFPASGAYEARVFTLLMMAYPAYSCSYIYATLLTANGNIKTLNAMAAAGVGISILLNLFIIPRYGAPGAALVAAITQWFLAISAIYFATKKAGLPEHPRWVLSHIAFLLLLCCSAIGMNYLSTAWPYKALLFAAVAGAGVVAFKFVSPSALRQFLLRR
jgi:peptidoglycan biosynthesis protein MviN/MurJ (putative lipid II flippase)